MIFATDLDRTIVFSEKFIHNLPTEDIVFVEKKEQKNISYMTKESKHLLKLIAEKHFLIPVTTRNFEEYKRISILEEVSLKYAIINNGGKILIDNKEYEEWNKIVQREINSLKHNHQEIINVFKEFYPLELFSKYKLSDDLIWVFILIEDTLELKEETVRVFKNYGWNLQKTGRKVYLIPNFINKWTALNYLNNKFIKEKIIASGDSLMDLDMVKNAYKGIVPSHGEISNIKYENVIITNNTGILAGEEILRKVINI